MNENLFFIYLAFPACLGSERYVQRYRSNKFQNIAASLELLEDEHQP